MKQRIGLLFLILTCTGYAQRYELSGTISDTKNPITQAIDIVLLNKTNHKLIKYAYITNGKFKFDNIETGEYILSVSCYGYQKESTILELDRDKRIDIVLYKKEVKLDEVTIKAFKNNITFNNGNIKATIENSIFESLSTPIDVLSKLPGIQIDPNQEAISIIGRGSPLIYLDNQRINLDQLKSLAVENIKDIEIIDNPSAKYEAEGRSLILISRKHRAINGYKLQLSEIASFKRRYSNYAKINTHYKKNKLELRANFEYNRLGFWEQGESNFVVPFQNIASHDKTISTGFRPQYIFGGGFFYQFTPSDHISGQVNYRTHTDKFPVVTNTFLNVDQIESSIVSDSQSYAPRSFLTGNINFNKKLNKSSNLFFGIQYSNYTRDLKNLIFTNVNQMGFEFVQNRNQEYQIGVFAARVDFEKKINDRIKLEIGGSLSHGDAIAFSDFRVMNPEERNITNYDYDEDTYASYVQLLGNINKIKYSLGVRSETNIVKGGFRNETDLLIDRKQTQLFPKIKLNIPIDSIKSITLNYNTTINRPSYLNASSITTYISPLVEFSRNVNLKPSITEELSTNFQYKKNQINLRYFHSKNLVFYSLKFDSSQNRVISSPQNFEKESGYTIELRKVATYKFWNTTNSLTAIYSKINDPTAEVRNTKPYLYYYSNNEFKLAPKTTLGINLWGLTKRYQGIFERNNIFVLGASISKTFFKNLKITVNTNDIFKKMNFEDRYTINDITSEDIFYVNAQEISFSVQYSFGKAKKSSFKNKDIDENLKRIQ